MPKKKLPKFVIKAIKVLVLGLIGWIFKKKKRKAK